MPVPCAATISWMSAWTWGSTVTISTVPWAARSSETSATARLRAVQLPARLDPPIDPLVPGFRHAIDPIAQRPEQEDVVQRPARGLHCQSAGLQGEPRRPHGPRVGGSGQAHHGKPRAIDLRPAVGRVPFGLGQQRRPAGRLAPGALIQRLLLGWHVAIHPTIEGFERDQQAAQGQIADCRHAVRFPGEGRSSIAGGRHDFRVGACRALRRSVCSCLCHLSEPPIFPLQGKSNRCIQD